MYYNKIILLIMRIIWRRRAGDGDAAGGGGASAGKDAAGVAVKKEDGVDGMHLDPDTCCPPAGLRQLPQLPYEVHALRARARALSLSLSLSHKHTHTRARTHHLLDKREWTD
jgi:hypothetical protein